MTDRVDPITRSRIMSRIRRKDTKCELAVRRALHAAGFRFRLHRKDLPGKPDLTLPRYRIAVYVHGCFWHWHSCMQGRMPKSNQDYWTAKIQRNVDRDRRNLLEMDELGWECRVVWECQVEEDVERLAQELRNHRL